MSEIYQVPATVSKIMTMGDHSLRLQVDVERELSPEENAKVFSLYNITGFFIFKAGEISENDLVELPEEKLEFKDSKSPSEILRNRLFVYYKETTGKTEGFEDWRRKTMDKIGQQYLDKINK